MEPTPSKTHHLMRDEPRCGATVRRTSCGLFWASEVTFVSENITCPDCLTGMREAAERLEGVTARLRLEKAAPELLEALEEIVDIQNSNSFTIEPTAHWMAQIAHDALAKLED